MFDVAVDFVVRYEGDPTLQGVPVGGAAEVVRVMPAGEGQTYGVEIRDVHGNPVKATANSPIHVPVSRHLTVTFMDAAGLRWRRCGLDQPERVIGSGEDRPRRRWPPRWS